MEHSRDLIRAREQIEQVRGDRIVVRSRFMPKLDLTASYDATRTDLRGDTEDHLASQLSFRQRLFEFGPDAPREIQLRADLRKAVYDYQAKVYQVTARVWELVHLILLQDEQIAVRRQSRDNFQDILDRQTARFEKRLASEEAKLQAELQVLSEELAINGLVRQQANNKTELLRLIGQTIGTEISVQGELAAFALEMDEAVSIALSRDVQISLREEFLEEQRRVVTEIGWQYAPDISLDAGVEDGRRNARVTVEKENRTWGVNLGSDFELDDRDTASDLGGDARWFAQIEARIPIFEGAARIGEEARERAQLRATLIELQDRREGVEVQVRQAYQSMLEADEEQRIQQKRVTIARRRLEISQVLMDKGQADEAKVESVREQFFNSQASLFRNQETYITRQGNLRRLMGYVE
jgi:outer membrane protein TolC